jgi:sugar (pentulose or hexulose) kinase
MADKEFHLQRFANGAIQTSERGWRASVFSCIRQALGGSGTQKVAMVAVTAQTACPICFDSSDKPVGPIISHLDKRAERQLGKASRLFPESYVATKLVGNLMWIKEKEPRNFEKVRRICDVKEYVGKLLTGEPTRDVMQLPRSRVRRMADVLEKEASTFGTEHDYTIPIGVTIRSASKSTGLQQGTPVLICPFDGMTGAIGSGLLRSNVLAEVAGTTEFMAALAPASRTATDFETPSVTWGSIDRVHPRDPRRVVYTSPPLGFFFDRFRRILYGRDRRGQYEEMERELSCSPKASADALFVPRFSFEDNGWKGRCQLINIGLGKARSSIMRTVMEGIAMNVKSIINGLEAKGIVVQSVRLSGGGSRSETWNQIRADVYGRPIDILQTPETGCLGGAVFATTSLGLYPSLGVASKEMAHATKRYVPSQTRAREYDRLYARFESAYKHPD